MDYGQATQEERRSSEEYVHMNGIMVVEIIIFLVALLAGLIVMLLLRHKLKQYDGMGEVKRMENGQKQPPKSIL